MRQPKSKLGPLNCSLKVMSLRLPKCQGGMMRGNESRHQNGESAWMECSVEIYRFSLSPEGIVLSVLTDPKALEKGAALKEQNLCIKAYVRVRVQDGEEVQREGPGVTCKLVFKGDCFPFYFLL